MMGANMQTGHVAIIYDDIPNKNGKDKRPENPYTRYIFPHVAKMAKNNKFKKNDWINESVISTDCNFSVDL